MRKLYFIVLLFLITTSCKDDNDCCPNEPVNNDITIPLSIYQKIYKTTSDIYIENGFVYINTDGVPDHKSPYFLGTQWESEKYVPYDGSNPFVSSFNLNPNRIYNYNHYCYGAHWCIIKWRSFL